MVNHNPARVVLMFLGLALFMAAMTLNTLTGFGAKSGIFQQSMEDVTLKYTTPITPAQWTLFVWDFMYFWLFSMFIYFVVGLCRRTAYDWLYTLPAVLPYGFHASLIISICFNIAWLFLFDRELLRAQLIISALMTVANYAILFFSCHGLKIYAAWLHKYHNMDLWLIRILVQNGVAVYATWGTVSTLLNLTIYLQHQRGTSRCDCAMLSLMLLLMELFAWFLLENFYLDEHVRYIVTIYPVVILWLSGVLDNSTSPKSPMYIFAALILAISCMMFVARITLITWRHRKQPLYKDSGLTAVSCSHNIMERCKMFLLSLTNTEHVVIHAWSIALAVITQVTSDIFYILAKDSNVPNALFQTSLRNMTETFPLEVTMDWWSEMYWVMIDFWSKAWLTEAVVGLLTRNVLGPRSCNPEIHPPVFYLTWTIICIVRMCHDPLWGSHAVFAAVFFRWLLPVLAFYMLYMSYSNLDKHRAWLAINNPRLIFWIRFLVRPNLYLVT
ncbi:hypothetical protein JOB18_044775 [Solea senegalensis]|uniref:Uncharacterized protein n=1 Tax=Solea senegalensis TaxID=28829 RepID=A0AAV6TCJ6_SOLSE|nr:hypothetical protein JOB18_044775 [Solea senegalensis]